MSKDAKKMSKDALEVKESDLERFARDELIREATIAKSRTNTLGAVGWQACPLPTTNKRFLRNMLLGTISKSKSSRRNLKRPNEKKFEETLFSKEQKHATVDSKEKRFQIHKRKHEIRTHKQEIKQTEPIDASKRYDKLENINILDSSVNALTCRKYKDLALKNYPEKKRRKKHDLK